MNPLQYFLDLVVIDSPSGEEAEVCAFLQGFCERLGFSIEIDQWGNMLAQRAGIGWPTLLCAHMDTVEPGRGIVPVVENDWLRSQGDTILGADNKAWLSSILAAVSHYVENSVSPKNAIELLFTAREETGGGVEYFDTTKLLASNGVIFDSSADRVGEIVVASPFIDDFTLTYTGRAAHASRSEEGINALVEGARFVLLQEQGKLDSGETTINVGKFNSGTGNNTVPGSAVIRGQIRSFSEDFFVLWKEVIAQNAQATANQTSLELAWNGYCPGYSLDPSDPFILQIEQLLTEYDANPEFVKPFVITDSNPLVNAGINVVSISDGVHAPHTVEECVQLSDLELMSELALAMIAR